MNEHETHEEVVKLARRELEEHERINCWFRPEFVRALIDRLEAAHKREAAFHAMTCEANDRLREHLQIALDACKRERGDCAKLHEAMKKVVEIAGKEWDAFRETSAMWEIWEICKAALAAPARNCDMPLVVDGPADNNADKVWIVFKRHNPDAYFDVPGLLRCIDWLLGHATEEEGGAK